MSILYFIIGLGLLIFIHELGHFLVAKFSGIRVERFSLGFGPRIIKFQVGETEYCISALPLGGYVKMSGQEDFEEGEIVPLDDPRAFSSKSLWTRLKVVLAGPFMNLLLPFVLMPIVFLIGRQEPKFLSKPVELYGVQQNSPAQQAGLLPGDLVLKVDGEKVDNWGEALPFVLKPSAETIRLQVQRQGKVLEQEITVNKTTEEPRLFGLEPMLFLETDAVIGEFAPDSPAKAAGIATGDKVISVDGKPVADWFAMSERVNASQGKPLVFIVERQGEKLEMKVTPKFNEDLKKFVVGVTKGGPSPQFYEKHRYGLFEAIKKGAEENLMLFGMTFKVLKDLVTLKASYKELGGPIKIAEVSAQAAKKGIGNFLYLLAFLSIQLGILNLLPIPVLDGGHVAFMAYEAVAKRPLPMKKRLIAQQVGMFLLLTLMILVTVNDIDSVWGFKEILAKVKAWF